MLNSSQPGGPRTSFKSEGMSGEEVAQSTEKAAKAAKALAGVRPIGREDELTDAFLDASVPY
ncbi:hypothetical protein BD309DRAFT_961384, partial [Dichomitus squalens]